MNVKKPIDAILLEHCERVPIHVMYGDTDWMYEWNGRSFHEKLKSLNEKRIKLEIIKGSGHQMTFDQPEQILRLL
jgi:pimeloyl-ACP methyl ester carboxylesterase